jgi:hypothetical protein
MSKYFPPRVLEAYIKAYANFGARSSEKLKPVHGELATRIEREYKSLGKLNFSISALGHEKSNKEISVPGVFYNKNSDITILDKNGKPVGIIAAKFPISNFAQNANNYFEGMLGETANLRLNKIVVAHAILLPYKLPYYKNAKAESDKVISKIEKIANKHIDKYRILMSKPSTVKPDALLFCLVEYGIEDTYTQGKSQSDVKNAILRRKKNKLGAKVLSKDDLIKKAPWLSLENLDFIWEHSNYDAFISNVISEVDNMQIT